MKTVRSLHIIMGILLSIKIGWTSGAISEQSASERIRAIKEITAKLNLDHSYVTNPCRLMPLVEFSPLVLIDDTAAKLKTHKPNPIIIDSKTILRAKVGYYLIGFESMKLSICELTKALGVSVTKHMIQRWVSGYSDRVRASVIAQKLKDTMTNSLKLDKKDSCLKATLKEVRGKKMKTRDIAMINATVSKLERQVYGKTLPLSHLKVATELIALQCLVYGTKLMKQQKKTAASILSKAATFFHRHEGKMLEKIVGKDSSAELIKVLLQGVWDVDYLTSKEKLRMASKLLLGSKQDAN